MKASTVSVPLEATHISYVTNDIKMAVHHFNVLMGLQFNKQFDAIFTKGMVRDQPSTYEAKIAVAQIGTFNFEILQPSKGNTIWKEFLDERGEGLHHFGAVVSDLDREISRFKEMEINLLQWGETEHIRVAFLDTFKTTGMLLELIQHI